MKKEHENNLKDANKKVRGFLGEFKEFALRGNMMDLAVGVIIGGAFGAMVTSLTDNILSPIIGLFTGQNFDSLMINLFHNADGTPLVTIKYGAFITSIINFIITAFVIFLLVKGMNRLASIGKKEKAEETPTTKKCPYCFTDIPVQATRCPNCTAELTGTVE